jgi:hypothetical protein
MLVSRVARFPRRGEAMQSGETEHPAFPGADEIPAQDVSQLGLAQLRAYRRGLEAEEDRVSYWRRLVHARLDVLEAQSHSEGSLTLDQLVRALGDTGSGKSRHALVRVRTAEELPELPVLEEMWTSDLDPRSEGAAEAIERLRAAERQLTDYRRALHRRLDEATAHLIARYRARPLAALDLIPRA